VCGGRFLWGEVFLVCGVCGCVMVVIYGRFGLLFVRVCVGWCGIGCLCCGILCIIGDCCCCVCVIWMLLCRVWCFLVVGLS